MTAVLVVDDHEVVRRGLRQLLAEGFPGAHVAEAASAAAATAQLGEARFDLVLLDVNLPGPGGLALLEELRRDWPRLPVLVVSAYPEGEFALRCLKLGASGYVTKDAAGDELVAAARKAMQGGRYVSAALAERLAGVVAGLEPPAPHEALSRRELEVLQLVARGLTLKEVAAQLDIAEKTAATYRARISDKLGLGSNVELTRYALKHGLGD